MHKIFVLLDGDWAMERDESPGAGRSLIDSPDWMDILLDSKAYGRYSCADDG